LGNFNGYIFDYRLGYVRDDCAMTGFDAIGDDGCPNGRIVTLGGYTTPEMARSSASWADKLYGKMGGKYQILSGCTDGYSTPQILMMFIREAILFQPKTVICLSGFYNIAYKLGLIENKADAGFLKTHPFATPRQLSFYRKITSRFGLGSDEVYYGEENHMPAWVLWLRQMAEINCLCGEFDIEFRSFLQPCVFSGNYRRSERENTFLCENYGLTNAEISSYHEGFQLEYAEIQKRAESLPYIADLSGIFDSCADVYTNACHTKDEFLEKLTERIL